MPPILDRLRARASDARFALDVLRKSGMVRAFRPTALPGFAAAARLTKPGPHLATLLHARMHPDKECVIDGDRRYTWRTFDQAVNQLAHAIAARGGAAAPVACMLGNGADYLIAQQALARVGAVVVQIGYRSKPAEVAYILSNAEPAAAIIGAPYAETFAEAMRLAGSTCQVIVAGADAAPAVGERWDDAIAGQPGDLPPTARGGDGGGVIVYTSGTTGKPKGATRSWKQTGFDAVADMIAQVGMNHDDRHLVVCPLYHSAAPAFVAITMSLGATTVLMNHFDPEACLALIERERVTSTLMVPTMLVRITALPAAVRRRYDTSSLRWIMSGAAPLATETARQVEAQFGAVLWNFYGATETGLVTLAGPGEHTARPGTVGRAMRGNQIRLLDDAGAEVPPGQVGEVYVRNSMLIGGYHKNRDATDRSIKDGFFSVGDLGRLDADGYLYMESRKHDMVISGGVNIYPREIEDHLHTHPAILDVAVVGVPDPEWGETLRAYVVLRPGHAITGDEVADYCRRELADYKRPRQVVFLDELPRNPTGKILKRELRDRPL
ncbi:MAG: AMP-binding protein [Myxococcales bacterium]|nr:AMP-binding protein [Myxococcales bacterium]MBK7192203.1 AMP-binding protein [Myxococcales bacterium]MBP6843558.1 AMP-binding protein [Kofleriaceae bacterium]